MKERKYLAAMVLRARRSGSMQYSDALDEKLRKRKVWSTIALADAGALQIESAKR